MLDCFACMYKCVPHMHLREHIFPGTGIIDRCDPIHGCWKLNLGSQIRASAFNHLANSPRLLHFG